MNPMLRQLGPVRKCKPYLFKIHFNIILLYTPKFRKWVLLIRFSNYNWRCGKF